jgi:hypothetical protein
MDSAYAIGNQVHVSFGSHLDLKGKVTGFIVELCEPVTEYYPTSQFEIVTTHVQTVPTVHGEIATGRIDGTDHFDSKPVVIIPSDARHICFAEYIVGKEYQMFVDKLGKYVDLGTLVKKECIGRSYDMDMKLTYHKDGVEKEHIALFGLYYREKPLVT